MLHKSTAAKGKLAAHYCVTVTLNGTTKLNFPAATLTFTVYEPGGVTGAELLQADITLISITRRRKHAAAHVRYGRTCFLLTR